MKKLYLFLSLNGVACLEQNRKMNKKLQNCFFYETIISESELKDR